MSEWAFVSGDDDGVIKTWDMRQKKATTQFSAHTDYITDLSLHPGEACLLAVSGDGTLSVNDLRKNKVLCRAHDKVDICCTHRSIPYCVAFFSLAAFPAVWPTNDKTTIAMRDVYGEQYGNRQGGEETRLPALDTLKHAVLRWECMPFAFYASATQQNSTTRFAIVCMATR